MVLRVLDTQVDDESWHQENLGWNIHQRPHSGVDHTPMNEECHKLDVMGRKKKTQSLEGREGGGAGRGHGGDGYYQTMLNKSQITHIKVGGRGLFHRHSTKHKAKKKRR